MTLPRARLVPALLGFNVGVELGQLAAVAAAWPVLVALRVPVVRELAHRVVALVAVADEGEREAAARVVRAAEQPHAEHVAVEAERALEVPDPEHGVEHAHGRRVALAAPARKTQ